jgi:hypothetical protein
MADGMGIFPYRTYISPYYTGTVPIPISGNKEDLTHHLPNYLPELYHLSTGFLWFPSRINDQFYLTFYADFTVELFPTDPMGRSILSLVRPVRKIK